MQATTRVEGPLHIAMMAHMTDEIKVPGAASQLTMVPQIEGSHATTLDSSDILLHRSPTPPKHIILQGAYHGESFYEYAI